MVKFKNILIRKYSILFIHVGGGEDYNLSENSMNFLKMEAEMNLIKSIKAGEFKVKIAINGLDLNKYFN